MNLTLKDIPQTNLTSDEVRKINLNMLLMVQLSTFQLNLAREIEKIYTQKGMYKLNIKHNYNKIINLIREHANGKFWEKFTPEQIDVIGEDADHLEELIMAWATNTMEDYFERKMKCSEKK